MDIITIISILLVLAIMYFGVQYFDNSEKSKNIADEIIKEVSRYGENELTPDELKISNLIFKMVKVAELKPNLMNIKEAHYHGAIDEISLEIFKFGMYRLKNKEMANKYFQNIGYIEVNKMKFINDFNSKISSHHFKNFTQTQVNDYLLFWILKFRDDTKSINSFLS
ncbi:hypothetical protein [Flavobacterium agrisoli]|uniref:Uncharacterized protein n=1 Tax=Flavobacterium agrisoli TaxID=2793066 RepID=A0A934UJC4_9FLAO|nr:hypothetical protein [Flavobacterium agrisoli]MBK0369811.1 hypothetical protein [Flavobacterium agrisoli]